MPTDFVLGVDVGYSNVKYAYGKVGSSGLSTSIRPAYAIRGKRDEMGISKHNGELEVLVGEGYWRVFDPKARVDRELHSHYHRTDAYTALLYGSLYETYGEHNGSIDTLVTGLPVSIAKDPAESKWLRNRLTGRHEISKGVFVDVKRSFVIPQGVGIINQMANDCEQISDDLLEEGIILVADPGYFSFDYVLYDAGERVEQQSGSTLHAVSVLIEQIQSLVHQDYRRAPRAERIEDALRRNSSIVMMGGRDFNFTKYLKDALPVVSQVVVRELMRSLRLTGINNLDALVIAGGGAQFYKKALEESFPNATVLISQSPVVSNAVGYWLYGSAKS